MTETEHQWHVDMQNEIVGPVSLEILRDWLRVGTITSETWVRRTDSNEWHPLAMVEELEMSEEEIQDVEELADQPAADIPLKCLRTDAPQNRGKIGPQEFDDEPYKPNEHDQLLNRAFGVQCIAVVVLVLGGAYILIGMLELFQRGNAHPLGALLLGVLIFIPFMIQYYILHSIVVSLKTSVKLTARIEEIEKKMKQ